MAVTNGDAIKVVVTLSCPDLVIAQNVYYWLMSDPSPDNPTNAQVVAAVDTRLDDMYSQIDDGMSDEYTVESFTVEKVEWNVDYWETVENIGTGTLSLDGLIVTDAMPHGCAAVVTAQTSRPQTRARKFLPGIAESTVADSTINATVLGYLAQYMASWLTDQIVTGSAELVPVVLGQSGPSAGVIFVLATAIARAIIGYQRRRKPGVGA